MRITKIDVLGVLTNSAIILAMCTILLGSYTRLTEAGLGCPDWPACYGFIILPKATQLVQAQEKFPNSKFEPNKAHNEMSHRYIAGLLGLSVLFIFMVSQWKKRSRVLTGCILLLVMMQAALGMWTVTLQLMPLVVLAHLLGGFSLLSLLVLLRLQLKENETIEPEPQLAGFLPFGFLVLFVLMMQISLGAWTSSNYAALACHQLPLCESGWEQHFSFSSAFSLPISLPMGQSTYQYGVMPYDARLSIHVLHRVGAFITFILLGSFSYLAWSRARTKTMKRLAIGTATLLILQCCLGLINVIAYLPLISAVAHNFVAANLLMLLVIFIYQLYQRRIYSHLPHLQQQHLQQQQLQQTHQQLNLRTNSNTAKV